MDNKFLARCIRCNCLHEQVLRSVLSDLTNCVDAYENGYIEVFEGSHCFDCNQVIDEFS